MTDPKPIRVMIVDDHDMVRRGLAAFLKVQADLELVGEASGGEEAVHLCGQLHPDVVLMDLVMPRMDGAAATRAIRERCPEIQVIALTSFKEKELVEGALQAGAIGYLLKNISPDELADAIREAHAGRPTLAPEAAQVLIQANKLERLAQALINAPPDASTLSEVLGQHIPDMFPRCQVEIHIFPDQTVLHHRPPAPQLLGGTRGAAPDPLWEWLRTVSEAHYFLPGAMLPWGGNQTASDALVVAPIMNVESTAPVGGIYISRSQDPDSVTDLLPVIKSLAAQISSTLHSAQVYAQTLAQETVARELAMAGQIQASFLPRDLPEVAGWQLAATLEPARETSGDFYDFIPLPNGRLGIVIADVSDKGLGAALYMALSRTLFRTYATEYHTRAELVLSIANRRILSDARAGLFVTAFYGVLDPTTGTLTYCNAGHNPPYLLNAQDRDTVQTLSKTGMVLGVVEDATWKQETVHLAPGAVLLLYTDGVTDAENERGKSSSTSFFGQERLLEIAQANLGRSAQDIQDALIGEVHEFMGDAPQFDDITLVIVARDFRHELHELTRKKKN
jgi:serine phosphatase RsbU (regulator of sigma subunit)/DNA-binding NarL/FixJ family response regulator